MSRRKSTLRRKRLARRKALHHLGQCLVAVLRDLTEHARLSAATCVALTVPSSFDDLDERLSAKLDDAQHTGSGLSSAKVA